MELLAVVLVLCPIFQVNFGYPSGAPQSACSSLTPVHKDSTPQETKSPYTVTARKVGDRIRVTISSPSSLDFQGFMLQARFANNRNRIADGRFTTQRGISRTLDCSRGKENTLTQVSKDSKSEIVTEWTPASGVTEDVIFRATVAHTFSRFWTNMETSPIRISSSGSTAQQNKDLDLERMYDNCFVNKGCFGYPADCVTRMECDILLSYVNTGEGVMFTMTGSLGSSQNYMAAGLSTDRRMGDDSVTECFMENGRVMVQTSWNKGRSNNPLTLVPEGMYDWQFKDGIASCSWTRPYVTNVEGKRFDMINSTYYILIAKGPMNDGHVGYHTGRLSSQDSVNFTAYEMIAGEGAHDAVKIHGAFMVTGWVALVSLAILMARHFKNEWEDQMLCGVKIWFAVHRGFMITALGFIVIAFIVIFVYKNGWNYETKNPHAILGCIATALGLLQPIMAAFRPSPDDSKRPIFNWLHWGVGNAAQIIAVITIFFAPSLEGSGLRQSFYWVMGVFVIVHCFIHGLFELHALSQKKKKNTEIKMQEMGSGVVSSGNDHGKSLSGSVVKVLLLGIYGIFLTVIMLALYSLIGTA